MNLQSIFLALILAPPSSLSLVTSSFSLSFLLPPLSLSLSCLKSGVLQLQDNSNMYVNCLWQMILILQNNVETASLRLKWFQDCFYCLARRPLIFWLGSLFTNWFSSVASCLISIDEELCIVIFVLVFLSTYYLLILYRWYRVSSRHRKETPRTPTEGSERKREKTKDCKN